MNPVAHVQLRKRSVDTATNWDKCFICQSESKAPTRKLGDSGLERVLESLRERKKYQDYAKWDVVERLEAANLQVVYDETELKYHKDCYGTFTSSMHLNRLKKAFESKHPCAEPEASTSQSDSRPQLLRSQTKAMNTDLCVFCQQTSSAKTRLVASMVVSEKLLHAAKTDPVLRRRLACVNDLVAGDIRYHLKCYVGFTRKVDSEPDRPIVPNHREMCLQTVAHEISIGSTKGEIYNLLDVWKRYSMLLGEFDVDVIPSPTCLGVSDFPLETA